MVKTKRAYWLPLGLLALWLLLALGFNSPAPSRPGVTLALMLGVFPQVLGLLGSLVARWWQLARWFALAIGLILGLPVVAMGLLPRTGYAG